MDGSIEALLAVDRSMLSRAELLDHLTELKTVQARVAAAVEFDIAAVTDPGDEKNLDREELALLLRWSFGFTQARIVQAHKLVEHLPATMRALSDGAINPEHARAAAEACYGLDQRVCAKIETRVLGRAGEQTITEFKRSLTRAVHTVDPRSAEQRHKAAKRREKGMWLRPLPDGLAGVWSVHDAVTAQAIMNRIRDAEKNHPPVDGDTRRVDERRADTLADLILGTPDTTTISGKTRVNIVVPLTVAMGYSDLPGELVGYGPIPAALCRQAMADPTAEWHRFVVAPTGELVDCSASYVPSAALRRLIVARDRTCRFPGCHRRACNCELDHAVAWNGTNTTEHNLHALCCRHHHLKHDAGWHVTRCTNGDTEWTSPTGRHYRKPPDPWPDG